jgi:outer membrane protein assembly factor BamB
MRVTLKDTIIVAGEFFDSINFGGGALSNNDNFGDIFVAELTAADGKHVWSKNYQCTASLPPFVMNISSSGEVFLGGGFFGKEVNFGGGPLAGVDKMDIFLAKLDATGNHIWSKRFGDAGSQSINDLVVGVAGDLSLVGQFDASFDLGGSTLPYQGGIDAFVARLDSAGNHLWSKPFGDSMHQSARNVATDNLGKVIVGGVMTGMVDFGGGLLTATTQDIFLAAFTSSGNHVWSRRFGESDAQTPSDISTDGFGNLIIAGQFQGSIDFGGAQLTTAGSTDICVAKLAYP